MKRVLIRGGAIISMDKRVRDLPRGDLLIENDKIAAVARRIDAPTGAEVIDATDMIVLPGFVNAHLHTWQSGLRGIGGDWAVPQYMSSMHRGLAMHFRPEDIYIANLMGALTSINSGITTLVDWCHNNPTPDHTDAAIDGLEEFGHPRHVSAWVAEADSETRRKALQLPADAARRDRAADEGQTSRARTG